MKSLPALAIVLLLSSQCLAEEPDSPVELEILKASVGVWDADAEVWPAGPDKPSMKFKGVETNQPHGKHWISSDFVSEFGDETVRVHSIIGYDLDKKQLVGFMVDHGPYAATLTGTYEAKTKSIRWTTNAKDLQGNPMVQKTVITQETPDLRVLTMNSGNTKTMEIRFVKRKPSE